MRDSHRKKTAFKGKQDYFNAINKAILAHIEREGRWHKVSILSIKDKNICEECEKNYRKTVDLENANIPPVPNCKNPICRCIYQAHE